MKLNKLEEVNSSLFIVGIYYFVMILSSAKFASLIYKSYFMGFLFYSFLALQILISILSLFLLFLFFRDDIKQFYKYRKIEFIAIIVFGGSIFFRYNILVKISIILMMYLILEISNIFYKRKKKCETSVGIVFLSSIFGIFLVTLLLTGFDI